MSGIDVSRWHQGVLFSAPSVYVQWNAISLEKDEPEMLQKARKPKANEKFIVISQTCDIKAKEEVEPYIEAILCTSNDVSKEKNLEFLHRLDRNSARRFVIDFSTGLVAEAKYKVLLEKKALSIFKPEPWPGTPERLGRFVRWLARRFDRPALPDILVETFQSPLEQCLARIDDDYPVIGRDFSHIVHELRINLPPNEEPPFDLQMVMMIKREGLSVEEAEAIDYVTSIIKDVFDSAIIRLNPEILIRTDEEISLAEHRATRPLFLEYLTYKGEEIKGIRPYERT